MTFHRYHLNVDEVQYSCNFSMILKYHLPNICGKRLAGNASQSQLTAISGSLAHFGPVILH